MCRGFEVSLSKYFLVIRDEQGGNLDVLEFSSLSEAEVDKAQRLSNGHRGELVICFAKNLESLFKTYTEYRPHNWKIRLSQTGAK